MPTSLRMHSGLRLLQTIFTTQLNHVSNSNVCVLQFCRQKAQFEMFSLKVAGGNRPAEGFHGACQDPSKNKNTSIFETNHRWGCREVDTVSGFRVQGLELRVQVSGLRAWS